MHQFLKFVFFVSFSGLSYLYPADLIPFTRRPLFIIIDSDKSHLFEVIYASFDGLEMQLVLNLKSNFQR